MYTVILYHVGTSIFGKWRGWANLALADAPPAPAGSLDFDLNMETATWSGEGAGSSLSSSNTGPTTSTPRDVRQPEEYELSQNKKLCYSILVSSLDSYPAFNEAHSWI